MRFFSLMLLAFIFALSTAKAQNQSGDGLPKIYSYVEQMPEFPGNLPEYLNAHVHYPDSAIKYNFEGRVMVRFVVDETGQIGDANIIRSANPYLDAEAIRVVTSMPPWKPGKQNGKPVKVYFNLPIVFRLKD